MARVRNPRPASQDDAEEAVDSVDVPAAVVCAWCGRGDCAGCSRDRGGMSGVIAIVPWERPDAPLFSRLFATVQATTKGADDFFRALPDGPVSPAFGFAVLAETFAVTSTAMVVAPLAVFGIPGLLLRFLSDQATRSAVFLATLVGVLGFTFLLVAAHAVHGLFLGKEVSRGLALRLGFYACGWDFGSSPAGMVAAIYVDGIASAFALMSASVMAPSRAIDAAMTGLFRLDAERAGRAKRRAMRVAMLISVPAVIAVMAAVVAATLFVR